MKFEGLVYEKINKARNMMRPARSSFIYPDEDIFLKLIISTDNFSKSTTNSEEYNTVHGILIHLD